MRTAASACAVTLLVGAIVAPRADAGIAGTTQVVSDSGTIFATHAPGDEDRLFVVGREGEITILDLNTNQVLPTPFLSIPDVDTQGEGGLLGMAFHPDYASNGKFYVYVTIDIGNPRNPPFSTNIREYTVSSNPNVANPTAKEVLSFVQPRGNHNGGWIGFSPNESSPYLYIASGDGGGRGDPDNNAQAITDNPFGKMLRIDVDGDDFPNDNTQNYAIPASNPFVGTTGDDEIWSYGLRNPFRASFDRDTGDLWIGDVGQDAREEINFQPASSTGGENYGWNRREGSIAYEGGQSLPGDVEPIYDYVHDEDDPSFDDFGGSSVTGGVVYRGPDPTLDGSYLFADFASSNIWSLEPGANGGSPAVSNILSDVEGGSNSISNIVAFGEDALGNVYIVTLFGGVYRLDTDALRAGDFDADGDINGDDLAAWIGDFGETESLADGNGDNTVDAADYAIWRDATSGGGVAAVAAAVATVPEPGAALLVGWSALGGLVIRRRPARQAAG